MFEKHKGKRRSCEIGRKTIAGVRVEMLGLELGGSCGQGRYALMSSRGRHSLVLTRGGERFGLLPAYREARSYRIC